MKKLSTLLVLLLTMLVGGVNCAYAADGVWKDRFIQTVSAALTSADDLQDGYYLLRNVGRKTFLRENDNGGLYLWNATNGSDDLTAVKNAFEGSTKDVMSSVVYITTNGDGTYKMQFRSLKYMPETLPHGGAASSNATAGNVEFSYVSGNQFNFRPKDSEYANGNGNGGYTEGTFTGWETSVPGADGNGSYQIFPVTLEESGVWEDRYIQTVSDALTSTGDLHDGYYLLRNVGRKTFLRENDNNVLWLWNATNGSDDLAAVKTAFEGCTKDMMNSVVYITKNGDGTYKMQLRSRKYMPQALNHGSETKSNETAGNIEIGYISGNQFNFRPTGGEYANGNGNGGYSEGLFVGWETSVPGANGNGAYQIFPVTLDQASKYVTDCNWTVTDGTNTLKTYTEKRVLLGSEATIPSFEYSYYYENPTIEGTDLVVSKTNCNFTVRVTVGEMPFKPATWYTVKFRNRDDRYLMHAKRNDEKIGANHQMTADYIKTFNSSLRVDAFNGALWAFVPDGLGVKLLCKQNGQYVTSDCKMDATGATFIVKTNATGGFSLQVPGNSIGHLGEHDHGNFGVWNDRKSQDDGGSNFQITEASTDEVLNVGKAVYTDTINCLTVNEADATMLTAMTEASLSKVKTLLANATSVEGLDAAFASRYNAFPKEGAWYRIKNINNIGEKIYISSEGIFVKTDGNLDASVDRTVRRKGENGNLVSQLWTMKENADGTYRVVNANTNRALSAYTGNNVDMPVNEGAGGHYFFRTVPNGFSAIAPTDLELMAYGYSDPQNAYRINAFGGVNNDVIRDYGGNNDSDKGNYWKFIEVTEIPVTVSAAGWASLALPFEVTIPAESGVVAYTAQRVDADKLVLSEITDGIIPANEGVILGKEGGADVKLAITHTGKAKIEGNKLVGATAKRIGFAAESTYALAKDETGEVAFLRNGLDCIPANKAYLLAEEVPNLTTTKLSFNFGTVNGINDAVAEDAQAETYYDLNGRVVLYPHNGIFVTKSGEKVFIK